MHLGGVETLVIRLMEQVEEGNRREVALGPKSWAKYHDVKYRNRKGYKGPPPYRS